MVNFYKGVIFVLDILGTIFVISIICAFVLVINIQSNQDKSDSTIVKRTIPIAKMIYDKRADDEDCKELNLELYVHLRSLGYHPDVNIGTLNGKGHLWLELDNKIFDTTQPMYYGKKVSELKDVYKLDKLIEVKK